MVWYDTLLYHAQVVKWNFTYPAVPGLAILHERFGYNSSFHLFAAMPSWYVRDLQTSRSTWRTSNL